MAAGEGFTMVKRCKTCTHPILGYLIGSLKRDTDHHDSSSPRATQPWVITGEPWQRLWVSTAHLKDIICKHRISRVPEESCNVATPEGHVSVCDLQSGELFGSKIGEKEHQVAELLNTIEQNNHLYSLTVGGLSCFFCSG